MKAIVTDSYNSQHKNNKTHMIMNYLHSIGTALMMASLVGCVSTNKHSLLEPVGPSPFDRAEVPSQGALQVFSAKEKSLNHLISSDDYYEKDEVTYESAHTDYTICTSGGERLKEVRNARTPNDDIPAMVMLSAGQYKVVAKAQLGDGWTITYDVPVVIQSGHKTIVHLEPDWKPSEQLEGKSSLVRGLDGRIIGWLAVK
jgi:hypothetical protein